MFSLSIAQKGAPVTASNVAGENGKSPHRTRIADNTFEICKTYWEFQSTQKKLKNVDVGWSIQSSKQ